MAKIISFKHHSIQSTEKERSLTLLKGEALHLQERRNNGHQLSFIPISELILTLIELQTHTAGLKIKFQVSEGMTQEFISRKVLQMVIKRVMDIQFSTASYVKISIRKISHYIVISILDDSKSLPTDFPEYQSVLEYFSKVLRPTGGFLFQRFVPNLGSHLSFYLPTIRSPLEDSLSFSHQA